MPKRLSLLCGLAASLLLLVLCSQAQSSAKKKVNSQDDLPRFSYPVKGSAAELVDADDATFSAFAGKVRADLDSIFRDYEIADKATMRTMLHTEIDLQQLAGEYPAALETIERLRGEEEKPSAKLTSGLIDRAFLQAAIETKSMSGPAFEESFRKLAGDAINALPWDVVQDDIKQTYAGARIYTKAIALANVKTDLDPSVQKSGARDNHEAWQLISYRADVHIFMPIETPLADVLKHYIAAHTVVKPDI